MSLSFLKFLLSFLPFFKGLALLQLRLTGTARNGLALPGAFACALGGFVRVQVAFRTQETKHHIVCTVVVGKADEIESMADAAVVVFVMVLDLQQTAVGTGRFWARSRAGVEKLRIHSQ